MAIGGLNLLAANHNAGGKKLAGIAQEGGQDANAKRASASVNNLAQKDRIEQAEEVSVNTGIKSKKPGSPTNIDGHEHAASSRGLSEVGQNASQAADADFKSKANNNQSEIAEVDQREKISTNLNIDVLGGKGHGYGHGYGHGWGKGYGFGHDGYGHGYGYGHGGYSDPDSIFVNLDRHMASADLQSSTAQDGEQLAKSDHGSQSINNLKQASSTNQMEDVSVNSDVNVGGRGASLGGPTVVSANDHTASGNAVAQSVQSGRQTALSDHGSLSVNNMSQANKTSQSEKVQVNTNVIV